MTLQELIEQKAKQFDADCCEFLDDGVYVSHEKATDFLRSALKECAEMTFERGWFDGSSGQPFLKSAEAWLGSHGEWQDGRAFTSSPDKDEGKEAHE